MAKADPTHSHLIHQYTKVAHTANTQWWLLYLYPSLYIASIPKGVECEVRGDLEEREARAARAGRRKSTPDKGRQTAAFSEFASN